MEAKRHKKRGFFQRHWLVIAISTMLVLLTGGAIAVYAYTASQQAAQTNEKTQQMIAEADKHIAQIEAEKKAAAEKEAKEAAAKEAAEKAKTSDGTTADAIDPKSCNAGSSHNNPSAIDVVVNKKHCIQPLNYSPADLVTSHGATLSKKAIDAYNQMYAAAAAAGQPFYVTSSYRSYTTQISTYNRWVSISGQAGADTYSARPGYSEHQTGFAFDVAATGCTLDCFGSTSQYNWFQQHAADYGFIQRYYAGYESITGYKAEEWHYRYVDVSVAKDMKAKGVKTLEQYWNVSGGDY